MARAHLYIMAISLCVVSSACAKKAKMRTVPKQQPVVGAQAAPAVPPPADNDLTPAPTAPTSTPEKNIETATAPAAPSAVPSKRSDDDREARRSSTPVPAPRRAERSDDGDLNRPRPRLPRQQRQPRGQDCDNCTVVQCETGDQRPGYDYREPRPAPRPRPVQQKPRREERIDQRQQFELDPREELHCRWEPTGKPMTYLKFDPVTKTAYVQHGWPQKWNQYTKVRLVSGLAPYGHEGLSLVNKKGVAIAHLKPTGNGTIWYERGTSYPYEAYFGNVPGAPQGEAIRGVCWTKSEQPTGGERSSEAGG